MPGNYKFYLYLSYISCFLISLPIIIAWKKRQFLDKKENTLLVLLILSFVLEIIIFTLHRFHINNLFVSRINGIMEFVLISFFMSESFRRSILSKGIKIFNFIFLGVVVYDLYLNGFNSIDNISLTTECILLMIYSIITFFHLIKNPVHDNILSVPLFWFNTAILTYFSGNLFLFVFSNYIENHFASVSPALWGIHSGLNIVFYLLISVGFWRTAVKPI